MGNETSVKATAGRPLERFAKVDIDGIMVHYRECGPKDAPAILLLHGFPSSGHMFRNLIPMLCDDFRLVAPDLPGFGHSDHPPHEQFPYTFATLAKVIASFTDIVGLKKYAMYIFDYGAPVGLRLALEYPERVTAIISQNGNAYVDGMGDHWDQVRAFWADPTIANRNAMYAAFAPAAVLRQYTDGVPDMGLVSPDGYSLDQFYLEEHDALEEQLDLRYDYRTNVDLYPKFQEYFRTHQPPLLAVWGKNDPIFLPAGAEAFKRDLPEAEIHFLDTGHFALETHCAEIAFLIREFMTRKLKSPALSANT
jgi:pimeloyl-ACP methyl ester carboxylesterase